MVKPLSVLWKQNINDDDVDYDDGCRSGDTDEVLLQTFFRNSDNNVLSIIHFKKEICLVTIRNKIHDRIFR